MTTQTIDQAPVYEQAFHYLEALHFHGFTVTIHSPKTSHNGQYCVTAYGIRGSRTVVLRGARARLDKAIRQVGRKLGEARLKEYAAHSVDAGLALLADQRDAEQVAS